MIGFVPTGQPDISQTRSVWYRGKRKSVLKGRWKQHLNDGLPVGNSIVLSGRINLRVKSRLRVWLISIVAPRPFKRSHKVIVALTVQEILDEHIAKKLVVG